MSREPRYNWFRLFYCLIAVDRLLSRRQDDVYSFCFIPDSVDSDFSSRGKPWNRLGPVPFSHTDPVALS